MTRKLEQKLNENKIPEGAHAHPRIVHSIVEQGSWVDDSVVQDMWTGLLTSSCTQEGDDDSNLLFINLLSNLTKLQAKVLNYACETAQKFAAPNGLVQPLHLVTSIEELKSLTGEKDINRLDRELDYLRGVSLIAGGILADGSGRIVVNLTPTPLALHMYVRCQGARESPLAFFKIPPMPDQASSSETEPKQAVT